MTRASHRRGITAFEVAHLAGVSQSAVSRAFTPGASVAPATRERVHRAAEQLGYRPNLIARSLTTRRSGLVGIAIGYFHNYFYPRLLDALTRQLHDLGYSPLLFVLPESTQADPNLERLLRYQVDALLLASTTLSSDLAARAEAAGIPVVLINRTTQSGALASVTGANRAGSREIAALFARAGHRRPAFMAGTEDSSTNREREVGFREGLRAHGLPSPRRVNGGYDREMARRATTELLSGRERPDALFCASDHMAIAAMDVARSELGLRIPDDLSIAGFDDAEPAGWPSYDLTTYVQPVEGIVSGTIALMEERILDPAAPPRHIEVPGRLILRHSVRVP